MAEPYHDEQATPMMGAAMRDNLRRHTVNEPLAALAEKDDEIARLTVEVDEQARLNGMGGERELALMGERDRLRREIAKLRAENERWQRVAGRHLDCAMADIDELARLRAGITAAVEGRYERQVYGPGDRYCQHFARFRHACAECMAAHLLALLDPPPAPDGGEGKR